MPPFASTFTVATAFKNLLTATDMYMSLCSLSMTSSIGMHHACQSRECLTFGSFLGQLHLLRSIGKSDIQLFYGSMSLMPLHFPIKIPNCALKWASMLNVYYIISECSIRVLWKMLTVLLDYIDLYIFPS